MLSYGHFSDFNGYNYSFKILSGTIHTRFQQRIFDIWNELEFY